MSTERTIATPSKLFAPSVRAEAAERDWPSFVKFSAICVQLLLLAILANRYNLESPAFLQLTKLAFAGFVVNHLLPSSWRMPFFMMLSLAGIVVVLDWQQATWLVGVGLMLVALCHVPAPFRVRVTLLLIAAGIMAAMRAGWIATPWPFAIWPLLGSMFMFRMMIYLYDVYHDRPSKSLSECLSYFFMLPNVCFPLFPVVDHQAFVRTYYNDDPYRIYQVGVRWIFRGFVHLILYRIIYKNWSIGLYDVENLGDLVHYCLWLFLLYLRVSGQFHVIVGMLHLFGFNLPETHHLYYLASSFTDFWRRINIYWKDFLMRMVFYPTYFQCRSLGTKGSLVVATLCVFFMTWFLHAVQWFWLRGNFLLSTQDMLFYLILAGFVVVNSLRELKHGQKRMGGTSWREALLTGLRTLAVFTIICTLWSMWTSESLSAWRSLWQYALVAPTASGWLLIAAAIVAIVGAAALLARDPAVFDWAPDSLIHETAIRSVLMVLLAGISIAAVNSRLGDFGKWIASAKDPGLNDVEMADLERGYYEDLMDVDKLNGELWRLYSKRPPEWEEDLTKTGLTQMTSDLTFYKFNPSMEAKFKGVMLRTNRWGMHDKEYDLQPPNGCYRIAILGASYVMGSGVDREHTFESALERRLNSEKSNKYSSYEILNFGVGGYGPLCEIDVLRDRVLPFKPNAVFLVGHTGNDQRAAHNLLLAWKKKVEVPKGHLRDLMQSLGIEENTPETVVRRRLAPHGTELLAWSYQTIVNICKENGIRPVYVFLPQVGYEIDRSAEIRVAEEAGFTVLDLYGAYGNRTAKSLAIAEWDNHPNNDGHQLIADKLYERFKEKGISEEHGNGK
jgi:alginate O-acetyltransferase complex protein AlgI